MPEGEVQQQCLVAPHPIYGSFVPLSGWISLFPKSGSKKTPCYNSTTLKRGVSKSPSTKLSFVLPNTYVITEMALKKREYNFYKKLMKGTLKSVPNHEIYGCKPIFPPSILLGMLPDYVKEENFEACKAIKDCIREWFEERGVPIESELLLKIS